jgi:hypothetical protein
VVSNGWIKLQIKNYLNLGKLCAENDVSIQNSVLLIVCLPLMHLLAARFVNASKPVSVYSDQTVADAFCVLSKEKTGVAVIDRKTRCLTGMIQCSDVYLLLDDNSLFSNRRQVFCFLIALKSKDICY